MRWERALPGGSGSLLKGQDRHLHTPPRYLPDPYLVTSVLGGLEVAILPLPLALSYTHGNRIIPRCSQTLFIAWMYQLTLVCRCISVLFLIVVWQAQCTYCTSTSLYLIFTDMKINEM